MSERDGVATSIRSDLGDDVEIHDSAGPDTVFVTNRSTMELTLRKYRRGVLSKTRWVNPFVTILTILSVVLVADFESKLGLTSDTWQALFLVALLVSTVWLGYEVLAYAKNRHQADIEFVIEDLKSN